MKFRVILGILIVAACISCGGLAETASNTSASGEDPRVEVLNKQKNAVEGFYKPMHVEEGDWLNTQKEPGEIFEEYIGSNPTLPTEERKTIYIQPIGTFNAAQRNAIRLTAEYMRAFYNLPVKLKAEQPLGDVPKESRDGSNTKTICRSGQAIFLTTFCLIRWLRMQRH